MPTSLTGATVLLKGAVTIVVDEDHVYASGSAPAWLGTAGAGDVLAGLTGALLAQQDDVATTGETVASAAYLHAWRRRSPPNPSNKAGRSRN